MIRRLPKQMGIWVKCDGTDELECPEKRFTANIVVSVNRKAAAAEGWGRGLRDARNGKGGKSKDYCPTHMQHERELVAKRKADREAERKRREEVREQLRAAEPKQPRKRKAASSATPTASPSADSAPAPAT